MMLSILSGSLIDVLPSFVSSSSADEKGISRLSSWVSASFWIGLFIYLFLRKVSAGVAKKFLKSCGDCVAAKTQESFIKIICDVRFSVG